MIKAITFDLDGVYFINGKANFIANLVNLGVDESEAKRVFLQSDQMNKLYKTGQLEDEEFWTWASSEWNIGRSWQELIDLLISGYEVDSNVRDIVKKVRANGYKTLICSNNFPARIEGLDKRFGFLSDFDGKALSYEVGFAKPDTKIFQELINVSGVEASEIIFSDDNVENITGAKSLGIETFLFAGFENFLTTLKSKGVNV